MQIVIANRRDQSLAFNDNAQHLAIAELFPAKKSSISWFLHLKTFYKTWSIIRFRIIFSLMYCLVLKSSSIKYVVERTHMKD